MYCRLVVLLLLIENVLGKTVSINIKKIVSYLFIYISFLKYNKILRHRNHNCIHMSHKNPTHTHPCKAYENIKHKYIFFPTFFFIIINLSISFLYFLYIFFPSLFPVALCVVDMENLWWWGAVGERNDWFHLSMIQNCINLLYNAENCHYIFYLLSLLLFMLKYNIQRCYHFEM